MKHIFTKKKILILTSIVLVIALTVGAYSLFGKKLEVVEIPEGADLVSTTLEKPTSGTPAEYDPVQNLFIAQGVVSNSSFSTITEGKTTASIVEQNIYAERVVTSDACYKKSISASTFVKVGTEYYVRNNEYLTRKAKEVKSVNEYTFVDEDKYLTKLDKDTFLEYYGDVPNGLTSYILNASTIISSFYNGQNQDGLHQYSFTLDPTLSTIKIRNEMKTMAGTEKHPVITSVEFTIWVDDDWNVVKTHNFSEYKVEMRGLGVVNCSEDTTEYFNFNQTASIPSEDYFKTKLSSTETSSSIITEPSTTDILLDAFAPYLTGKTPLCLAFETSGKLNLTGVVNLYINPYNLQSTIVVINISDFGTILYKDNYIYLTSNNFKTYINLNESKSVIGALTKKLGLNLDTSSLDINAILQNLDATTEENRLSINLNFSVGDTPLQANLKIDENKNINAKINIDSLLDINLTTTKENIEIENDFSKYLDLSPLLNLLANGKLNFETNIDEIYAEFSANLYDKYLIGNCKIFNKNIGFELSNGTLWLEIDGILTKFNDFDSLLNSNFITNLGTINSINLGEIFNSLIDNLEYIQSDSKSCITTKIFDIPIVINFDTSNNSLILKSISLDVFEKHITLNIKDSSTLTPFSIEKKDSATSINNFVDLLNAQSFNFNVHINSHTLSLSYDLSTKIFTGILDEQLEIKIVGSTIYGKYNDLKFKTTIDEITEIINNLCTDLNLTFDFELSSLKISDIINSINLVKDNDKIFINCSVLGLNIKGIFAIIDNQAKFDYATITISNSEIRVEPIKEQPNVTIDETEDGFIDATKVINNYYDTLLNLFNAEDYALGGTIEFNLPTGDTSKKAKLAINSLYLKLKNGLNISADIDITISDTVKTSTYNIKINYYDSRIYFEFNGIKGQFGTDEFDKSKESINKLLENVPQLYDLINSLAGMTNINLDFKTWDIYSIIKNITIGDNMNLILNLDLSTLLVSSDSLDDLLITIEKSNDGLNVDCNIDNLINNIPINISLGILPTTGIDYNVSNKDDYTVFDSINNLLETIADTVSLRHFYVSATLNINLNFPLTASLEIALDLKVDVHIDGSYSLVAKLTHSKQRVKFIGFIPINPYQNDTCTTTIYSTSTSDTIYYTKDNSSKITYYKFTQESFSNNALNIICDMLDLGDTISNLICNNISTSENTDIKIENVFNTYTYDETQSTYCIELNLNSVNSALTTGTIKIKHTNNENETAKLENLSVNIGLNVVNIIGGQISLSGTLVDRNNKDYGTLDVVNLFIANYGETCAQI